MKIIHEPTETSPFLVVFKERSLPSAPLFEGDRSVLTEAVKIFPEILTVSGKKEIERGLVHRIDTETSGLVLIATTQESYDSLVLSQKENKFEKWYRAEIENLPNCTEILSGFPNFPAETKNSNQYGKNLSVKSLFRPYGKKGHEVRPVTNESGKFAMKKGGNIIYQTDISFESEKIAFCHITRGYRHQVRCHLAWCGFPVKGDLIYNPNYRQKNGETEMKFTAYRIDFPHPLSGELLSFEIPNLQM